MIDVEDESDAAVDWKIWVKIRIVIEFDFKTCLFVEKLIDSKIDRFDDFSIEISTSCECFFLIQMTNETRYMISLKRNIR
jgi:hypothetical protein